MTAEDLIRRSYLSIGVIGESDTLTGTQLSDGFATLNMFLSSIGGSEGFVTLQYADPTDDLMLDDGYELMVQMNVAVLLAPDNGKEAPPTVQRIASSTKRSLKRKTTLLPKLRNDDLLLMSRRFIGSYFDAINGDPDSPAYIPNVPGPFFPPADGAVTGLVYNGSGQLISYQQNGNTFVLTYAVVAGKSLLVRKQGGANTVTYNYDGAGNFIGETIS